MSTKLRRDYPLAFKSCIPEALIYAKCVAGLVEVKGLSCDKQFKEFQKCISSKLKPK